MTSDDFRAVFRPDNRPIMIFLKRGDAMGVGLNGDKVVLHDRTEVPLEHLVVLGDTLVETPSMLLPPIPENSNWREDLAAWKRQFDAQAATIRAEYKDRLTVKRSTD